MSEYNVDTLENKIIVEAQEALQQLDKLTGGINKAKESINKIKEATGLKEIEKQANKTKSSLTKLQLIGNSLKKAFNFAGLIYGAKKLYGIGKSAFESSVDYIETLNLFEVSMGKTLDQYGNIDSVSSKYYNKALKFQNQLNEAFGTNIEETMRYQALYNQMTKSMGIGDEASYTISENLTKLGIDLASLFNKEEADVMEALRAGVLAGQTKPLRNYGLDVTQQTLAPLASELGIERSVKQLSQAEKMILRYIAVLRQASSAHGDFAETIESPANQLKVFKQQFVELKTAIGNLFQGMLGQILPYVNAVLMVIKELIKAVANLFGFTVSSSNTNLAQQTGIDDLDTGLSSAVGSAKELIAQLMGFDEINNISTDTSSGGGGGGVSSTGIDSKLLDAMREYDNLMGKVKMKATDIRDKIMDWLGFTGDVEHDTKRVKEILDTIGIVLKTIIFTWIGTKLIGFIGNIINGLGETGALGVTNKLQLAVAGIATSWGLAQLSAKNYVDYFKNGDGKSLFKAIREQTGSILAGAGAGATIGSIFGPVGTGVGTIAGAVTATAGNIINTQIKTEDEVMNMALEDMQNKLEGFRDIAKKAISDSYSYSVDDYNEYTKNYIDAWQIEGLGEPEQEAINQMIEGYRKLALAEVQLFDNGGERLDNYYNKYVNVINEITGSTTAWKNLYDSYTENNNALKEASNGLDIYISKLGNSAYKVTVEDINKINYTLDEMSGYVKASGDAFINATIASVDSLKKEGYISQETADLVVTNAIRKAKAEGDAFEAYKLGLKDLDTQLKKGTITQEEYRKRQQELYNEWQSSITSVDDVQSSLENLHNTIASRIDMGSWETAKEYVGKFGDSFDEAKVQLANARDSMIQFYDDSIEYAKKELANAEEINGIESEQYKEALDRYNGLMETREATLNKYDDDVQKLKESTYRNLKTIEMQLEESRNQCRK